MNGTIDKIVEETADRLYNNEDMLKRWEDLGIDSEKQEEIKEIVKRMFGEHLGRFPQSCKVLSKTLVGDEVFLESMRQMNEHLIKVEMDCRRNLGLSASEVASSKHRLA